MTRQRYRDILVFGAFLAALLAGTCWLPYRFPPSHFVAGASFQVGFNNAIAYLAYLPLLIGLSWMVARWLPAETCSPSWGGARRHPPSDWLLFGVVVLGHALLFAALYLYKGRFVFAESLYFQTLLYRMTLGEVPYLNFSFYYGPSMLYPAYWLAAFLSVEAAYACWFVATYLLGLFMLWWLLRLLLPSPRLLAGWFLLLALALFNPWTGLNVTFVRYLFPSVVFVAAVQFLRVGGRRRCLATVGLLAVAMAYSFEVAALSVFGVAAATLLSATNRPLQSSFRWLSRTWFAASPADEPELHTLTPPRRLLVRGLGVLVAATAVTMGLFHFVDPSGQAWRMYPEIARSYAAGAHNVPIYPNVPFIALTAVSLLVIGGACRWLAVRAHAQATPWVAAYLLLALVTQRAAFGVAEPSRFAFFSLPTVLLGLFLSTAMPWGRRFRRWLAVSVVAGLALPMQYYHVTLFVPFVAARWSTPHVQAGGGGAKAGQALEETLSDVVRHVGIQHPYVMYEFDYESFPVYRRLGLRYPSYYTLLSNARTEEGMRRVIDDVRRTQAIVVARVQDLTAPRPMPRSTGVKQVLDVLSGAHTRGSRLQAVLWINEAQLEAPFREFLRREYHPVYEEDGIVALGPRSVRRRMAAW